MTFHEALFNFKTEIAREYNSRDGLLEITLDTETFVAAMQDLTSLMRFQHVDPKLGTDATILGVKISVRHISKAKESK